MFSDDFLLSNSISVQQKSFLYFLQDGLIAELNIHFPFFTYLDKSQRYQLSIRLDSEHFFFQRPSFSSYEAVNNGESYTAGLYVPAQCFFNNLPIGKKSFLFLGEIPFMTEEGSFIINGSPRTVVGQLIRTPGIYYKVRFGKNNSRRHLVSFLSAQGCWFRIWIDPWGRIWGRINKFRKVPICLVLYALGMKDLLLGAYLSDLTFLEGSLAYFVTKFLFAREVYHAIFFFYLTVHGRNCLEPVFLNACSFLFETFFHEKNYSFGTSGRAFLDSKLGHKVQATSTLKPEDILDALEKLLQLEAGFTWNDNIDNLKNRRARFLHEIFRDELNRGLVLLKRTFQNKFNLLEPTDDVPRQILKKQKKKLRTRQWYRLSLQLGQMVHYEKVSRKVNQRLSYSKKKKQERKLARLRETFFPSDNSKFGKKILTSVSYSDPLLSAFIKMPFISPPYTSLEGSPDLQLFFKSFQQASRTLSVGNNIFWGTPSSIVEREPYSSNKSHSHLEVPSNKYFYSSPLSRFVTTYAFPSQKYVPLHGTHRHRGTKLRTTQRRIKNTEEHQINEESLCLNIYWFYNFASWNIPLSKQKKRVSIINRLRFSLPLPIKITSTFSRFLEAFLIKKGNTRNPRKIQPYFLTSTRSLKQNQSSPSYLQTIKPFHQLSLTYSSRSAEPLVLNRINQFFFLDTSPIHAFKDVQQLLHFSADPNFVESTHINRKRIVFEKSIMQHDPEASSIQPTWVEKMQSSYASSRRICKNITYKIKYVYKQTVGPTSTGSPNTYRHYRQTRITSPINNYYSLSASHIRRFDTSVRQSLVQRNWKIHRKISSRSITIKPRLTTPLSWLQDFTIPDDFFSILLNSQVIEKTFNQFFGLHPLSQLLDQSNPLSTAAHQRRLTSLGPGGVNRDAGLAVRDIHPSHYGRLCPIETPEGKNAGLVHALALYARVQPSGILETPFSLNTIKAPERNETSFNNLQLTKAARQIYFCTAEEESIMTCEDPFLFALPQGFEQKAKNNIPENDRVNEKSLSFIDRLRFTGTPNPYFQAVSPVQILSLATSLIPFLEHDDANRALMGSNMQRQAVSLMYRERPIVGTGLERVATQGVVAKRSGIIYQTSSSHIFVRTEQKLQRYPLYRFARSNQATFLQGEPLAEKGEFVLQGTTLGETQSTYGGEVALGRNLLLGYMPWEGYNFEDAVVINERLVKEDLYTSIHIEKYEVLVDSQNGEELTSIPPKLFHEPTTHLDHYGIVREGTLVQKETILIGKRRLLPEESLSPGFRLRARILDESPPFYQNTSFRLQRGSGGKVLRLQLKFRLRPKSFGKYFPSGEWVDKRLVYRIAPVHLDVSKLIGVQIFIAAKRRIQIGDKVAGRHGNKGIVSMILPEGTMPYLQDGTPLDMVLNPLGVPSRMNLGQLFESLLGLAGKHLCQSYRILPFDELHTHLFSPTPSSDRTLPKSLINSNTTSLYQSIFHRTTQEISRGLVYTKLVLAQRQTGHTWLFHASIPGKMYIFDGRTGRNFSQPVTVGISYILKLIHLVDEKIHGRTVRPYAIVTQQPLQGKARNGGQRLGEMEIWALEAFGVAYLLQEILTCKSDDMDARQFVYEALLDGSTWLYERNEQRSNLSFLYPPIHHEGKLSAVRPGRFPSPTFVYAQSESKDHSKFREETFHASNYEVLYEKTTKDTFLQTSVYGPTYIVPRQFQLTRTELQNRGPYYKYKEKQTNRVNLPEAFQVVCSELQALCLDISSFKGS